MKPPRGRIALGGYTIRVADLDATSSIDHSAAPRSDLNCGGDISASERRTGTFVYVALN
jgi:hypothetical protein